MSTILEQARAAVNLSSRYELRGEVNDVRGLVVEATGPFVPVGSNVTIQSGRSEISAQVVGFRRDKILIMPYGELQGLAPGAIVRAQGLETDVLASERFLGRVINAHGEAIDKGSPIKAGELVPLYRDAPNPVTRRRIEKPFDLGVRALNGLLTVGVGQRVGIMAGSGVGKSTLLGMIARHAESDINIIALIGERGREVREFIERDLGPEGLKRSIVVVATGDESALLRIRAAFYATALAEYFRDKGKRVVLMLDSTTRFAMAQREVGLSIGEPPSTKGYTPSVFSLLPKLLERAGTCEGEGSITGLYTVLVEGDDMNEPIADATRGILDGHVVLSRKLAMQAQFPAIEILESVSRVMPDISTVEQQQAAQIVRRMIASYRDTEDLITVGAYKPGQNHEVDKAVALMPHIRRFLAQKPTEKSSFDESVAKLIELACAGDAAVQQMLSGNNLASSNKETQSRRQSGAA